MRFSLIFGYNNGHDEWLKAESDNALEIRSLFYDFIKKTFVESPAHVYVFDNAICEIYSDLYAYLKTGNN